MKRFLSVLIVLCMIISVCPVVALADNANVNAVRTVYFNSQNEWGTGESSSDGGGVSVLVAWNGSDNWQSAKTFTDTDGTVTTQSVTSGTAFNTSRNALIAFEIPEDFDAEKTGMVTLSFSVKKIKQVATGVRFAVYGNSVDGTWSASNANKATFGANGTDSGLVNLPLLGLTTPVKTGADGEKVSLSSHTLTDYVKQMAAEGKSEVTFRLAIPYGGAWIYNAETATPPTLKIEEGVVTTLNVKTVFYNGEEEVSSSSEVVKNVVSGSTYTYTDTPTATIVKGEDIFVYSKDRSTLSVIVAEDGSAEIIIAYEKYTDANSYNGYVIDDEGAWCWFADPRAISYKNDEGTIDVTIIGYIDVHGNIKATQINNLTDKVDEVLIRTNIQPDDHNNPTFLVLPDERIIVFYSRHTDEACFWYRVTEEPGDITTFGEEKCLLTSANTTYPSPFLLSDDPDNIYLCWRGIEWHPTIAKVSIPDENGDLHFTYGPYQMVRSTNAGNNIRPYAKYASNGKDKIYMSYTSTHPDNFENNWLYFNQIDIKTMTMQDINGNTMSTIANGPLAVNHTNQSHIVDQSSGVRNWLWQVAIDENGYPVIANVRINGGKTSHDYYYVKWNGSSWVKTFLTNAGGKFHPSNTEYCYSGGMSIDTDNPNIIYCSKPVAGVFGNVYEIFKYTMSSDGSAVLSTEQITENSIKNNVRPWVIPNSEGDDLRVLWMNGDYDYWMVNRNYPAGYPTAAMANVPLPTEEVNLDDAVLVEDYDELGGAFASTQEMFNTVDAEINGNFTVSTNVYFTGEYGGSVIEVGNVTVGVKNLPTRYADDATGARPRVVLTVDGVDYASTNAYGTSDEWKNQNVQTGGEYFFTPYEGYVNLTVSYDGEYITVYRDGLVDIKEKVDSVVPGKVLTGGFNGYTTNVTVYDRVLNHDEIKALSEVEYTVEQLDSEGDITITKNFMYLGEKLAESETLTLTRGTDTFRFLPEETYFVDGVVYLKNSEATDVTYDAETLTATAVYDKGVTKGDNLVTDGDFTDADGNFSWGTWQSPETGNYFRDTCEDWFYKVNRDTNAAALYKTGSITADDYALGTRWNDGSLGLCSMANFIEVEAGKTYYVSYDYKHKTAGTDSAYISTAFVTSKTMSENASDNNIPVNVSTEWQTNTFAITAPEDGYIYFHFSWLGNSNNAGNGPYWYFDNFAVYEVEPEAIIASVESVTDSETLVKVENVSAADVENLKIYAASYNADGIVTKAEVKTVTVKANDDETLTFALGGDVKVYIWDSNMKPVCGVLTK